MKKYTRISKVNNIHIVGSWLDVNVNLWSMKRQTSLMGNFVKEKTKKYAIYKNPVGNYECFIERYLLCLLLIGKWRSQDNITFSVSLLLHVCCLFLVLILTGIVADNREFWSFFAGWHKFSSDWKRVSLRNAMLSFCLSILITSSHQCISWKLQKQPPRRSVLDYVLRLHFSWNFHICSKKKYRPQEHPRTVS